MLPKDLACRAFERNEVRELLLGSGSYAYKDRFSPAPGPTDITSILSGVEEFARLRPELDVDARLQRVLISLCDSPEGVLAVASAILFVASHRHRGTSPLQFDLDPVADAVRAWIRARSRYLPDIHRVAAEYFPSGFQDGLARLSELCTSYGGPEFALRSDSQPDADGGA